MGQRVCLKKAICLSAALLAVRFVAVRFVVYLSKATVIAAQHRPAHYKDRDLDRRNVQNNM